MRAKPAHVVVGLVIAALVAQQIAIPELAERDTADRLTERGGRAEVSISSFPALRLLLGGRGERLEVRAHAIEIDPFEVPAGGLERADGFDEVDVRMDELEVGPVRGALVIERGSQDDPYEVALDAEVVPRELARFAGERFGGPLGGLAGGSLPLPDVPVPIEVEARVESRDGRPEVVEGGGSVAGIPLGPLAELVVGAVVSSLRP